MTEKKSFFISGSEKKGYHLIMVKDGVSYSIGKMSMDRFEIDHEISTRVEHGEVFEIQNLSSCAELD